MFYDTVFRSCMSGLGKHGIKAKLLLSTFGSCTSFSITVLPEPGLGAYIPTWDLNSEIFPSRRRCKCRVLVQGGELHRTRCSNLDSDWSGVCTRASYIQYYCTLNLQRCLQMIRQTWQAPGHVTGVPTEPMPRCTTNHK